MSFCLQLSTSGILRNVKKKNTLLAFLLFSKANKVQYQYGKIGHFFENANLEVKMTLPESFSYTLYNFYNPIYFFLCRLPGSFHLLMVSLRPISKIHSFLRLSGDNLWSQQKESIFLGSQ